MSEVVVTTRVRLARNLSAYPFPGRLSREQANEVVEKVCKALSDGGFDFVRMDMSELSENDRLALVERHLISPEFVNEGEGRVLLLSKDNTVAIMLNEEDHIRLQVIREGFELDEAYKTADQLDDILNERLQLAYSERLGFLTRCPTNLGTALRASVMLHLPALEINGAVARIGSNLSKLGLTMRGLYGESSRPAGAFYQLSNQVSLGISESAAIENLKNITTQLIAQEVKARDALLGNIEVEDKVARSLGLLKCARLMDHTEAMQLLSNVRLGVSSKVLETLSTDSIDRLITDIQPANLIKKYGEMSPRERDVRRAELLRERLN